MVATARFVIPLLVMWFMRLVLYQPDIPQNTGAILRLAACLGADVDIIEPTGFVLNDRRLMRSAMDYGHHVTITRHVSWDAYHASKGAARMVLLTTKGDSALHAFRFRADDHLLLGRESAGVPAGIADLADARIVIPLRAGARSLNVAIAAAIALTEALRQTGAMPDLPSRLDER